MSKQYLYFTINIQPKNCDGTGRTDDYLSPKLIEQFKEFVFSKSNRYAIAIETNKDEINHHFHSALKVKDKTTISYLQNKLYEILEQYYDISENGYKRAIVVKHHTKTTFENTACGYLTKQFQSLSNNNNNYHIKGFSDPEITEYKERYLKAVEQQEDKKTFFTPKIHRSDWILDKTKKDMVLYKDVNSYFKAVRIILEDMNETNISSENIEKYYLSILQVYKIGFQFASIKKFHRDFLQFIFSINQNSEMDTETLVNFFSLKKSNDLETNYIPDIGYTQTTISRFWSIE